MKASNEIKAYIKRKEGCAQMRPDGLIDAYLCPAKVWTIGYGTTRYPNGQAVRKLDVTTPKQAEEYFEHDIAQFEEQVTRLVKVRLTQGQFDALVSFTYNLGGKALEESTLLKKLNKGDYRGAANEFLRWDKITNRTTGKKERLRGLSDRRAHEKRIFEGGDNAVFYPDSNNTPFRNIYLPLPTVMRDNADAAPPTSKGTPIAIGTGSALTLGAVAEYTEQATPILYTLQNIDEHIAYAILGLLVLCLLIWFIRKYK